MKKGQRGKNSKEDDFNELFAKYRLRHLIRTPVDDVVAVALHECMKAIEVVLWEAGADWTNGARIWFESTLSPLFEEAVTAKPKPRHWKQDRNQVLTKLEEIVRIALTLAGPGKQVEAHHAAAAFEHGRCYRVDDPNRPHPEYWCA